MPGWEIYIPIIATQGIAVAERLWQLTMLKQTPTQEEWDELKKLGEIRAVNLMRQAIVAAGIDAESDEAKALLAAATTGI